MSKKVSELTDEMSWWKVLALRILVWVGLRFVKAKEEYAFCCFVNPLFGKRKYGTALLTVALAPEEEDPFTVSQEIVRDFKKLVDEPEPPPGKVIPFKLVEGGKKQTFPTYTEDPFITVVLVTHSGDCHLLGRALKSLVNQDMDLNQIQVLIYFDGTPTPEENALLDKTFASLPLVCFREIQFIFGGEKNGYYCVGRNRVMPLVRGLYVGNMDADNEYAPNHLSSLLTAIRTPNGPHGFPHFVYSRRRYLVDAGVTNAPTKDGVESPLVLWERPNIDELLQSPTKNFIDTGDLLISKSALFFLAERTGCVWNTERRRFGDWDLVARMALAGFRGRAIDQATNLYHWTGKNLQVTRGTTDIVALPQAIYDAMKAQGMVKEPE